MENQKTESDITRLGNPRKPEGEAGEQMLKRMNESHYRVTGWALGFWNLEERDRVLDIGCGGGATLHRLAEKIGSGHLTGIDYSPVSVESSRKLNAHEIESGQMDVLEASVEHLPFEDDQFDKIITVESFYFWPDPQENLKEVLRVLKPRGTFLLVAEIYQNGNLTEKQQENISSYQLFNPTKQEFKVLFQNAGFAEIRIHTAEGENWICVEGRKDC